MIALRGRAELEAVAAMDKVVDALHIAIIEFLGKVSRIRLTARQSGELMQLVEVTNNLEHIGDMIATSMVASARKRIDEDVSVSDQTAKILTEYHAFVLAALNDALRAVTQEDAELARGVSRRKKGFSELEPSRLDDTRGKRLSVWGPAEGTLRKPAPGPDEPVLKTTSGLLVLPREGVVVRYLTRTKTSWVRRGVSTCDQCRDCTDLCPRYLLGYDVQPHKVMRSLLMTGDEKERYSLWAAYCCECNICSLFSPEECSNYFAAAGYGLT